MKTLLYVHGYGSDNSSRKYLALQKYFKEEYIFECLEWTVETNIRDLLSQAVKKYSDTKSLLIVGDSTGANLAWQLRELRKADDQLILLSPLLDIRNRKRAISFPETFTNHLVSLDNPVDTLIIAAYKDDVIDQEPLFARELRNYTLFEVSDTHRLEKFNAYLPNIKRYLRAVSLSARKI